MLATQTPWWLAYNVGEKVEQLSPQTLSLMAPAQIEQILGEVVERAQTQYQFVYAFYPIIGNYFSPDPKPPITQLFRFLNTPRVLDWLRRLSGRDDVKWVDAQATLYQSGHFLKSHSDKDSTNARAAAYVLELHQAVGARLGRLPPVLQRGSRHRAGASADLQRDEHLPRPDRSQRRDRFAFRLRQPAVGHRLARIDDPPGPIEPLE